MTSWDDDYDVMDRVSSMFRDCKNEDATNSVEERISTLERKAGLAIPTHRTNTRDSADHIRRIIALERKNDLDQIEANLIFAALNDKQKGIDMERRICALEGKPPPSMAKGSKLKSEVKLHNQLESQLVALEKKRNLPSPEETPTLLSLYRRAILLETKDVSVTERIKRLTEFNTYGAGQLAFLNRCLRDLTSPSATLWSPATYIKSLSLLVDASFLFEDSTSERVFATLKEQFDKNLWQRGVQIATPTKATRFVYVVTPAGSRLEIGQNLAEDRIKDVLSGDDSCRMFILAVHSGMTADPIHFSSSYGDRIQVGQIVFSDRTGSPTLVSDARGVPLRECIDKLVTFLTPGTAQGTDGVNTGSEVTVKVAA